MTVQQRREEKARKLLIELLPQFSKDDDAADYLHVMNPNASPTMTLHVIAAALHFLGVPR